MLTTGHLNKKKFQKIYRWEDLIPIQQHLHDPQYLKILASHGMTVIKSPVPLIGRYSRGRRWTKEEFETCYEAWLSGNSLTLIAALLNRNPQDMIYKLTERCKKDGITFSQKGQSEGGIRWTSTVASCAEELFEAGLPAWRIAVLFHVDFEHVEKALFANRKDYGHKKKNPFAICTDHKHKVNDLVLRDHPIKATNALDAFSGSGIFTIQVRNVYPECKITSVEIDQDIFLKASQLPNVNWINSDNINVMQNLQRNGTKFDIIDLDPFVTCHEQIDLVWKLLNDVSLCFLTLGGEYRRSFIQSNRKAIAKRYGFFNIELDNKSYLYQQPHYFIGWVAAKAASNGFSFSIIRAVRYPNTCRFWLKVVKEQNHTTASQWLLQTVIKQCNGYYWQDMVIPSFRDVRYELVQNDTLQQRSLF